MAVAALTDAHIYANGLDLQGYSNQVILDAAVEDLDSTVFGTTGWRTREAGLKQVTSQVEGFFDAATLDAEVFTQFAATGIAYSVAPSSAADGDLAYTSKVMRPSYHFGGQVGQLIPYTSDVQGYGTPLVRGKVGHPGGTARTTTGTGTAYQLGALSATQKLYAALHVLSVSGSATPTLTVKVQSDDASGFPSATDRITFTAATATGGQFSSVAGAVTDDWWRVSWTIAGTNPSFLFAVVFGIA